VGNGKQVAVLVELKARFDLGFAYPALPRPRIDALTLHGPPTPPLSPTTGGALGRKDPAVIPFRHG
jgi:hypothetical protein